jgi:hypothetical protein
MMSTHDHGPAFSGDAYSPAADSCPYTLVDLSCGCQDVHYACGYIDREHDHVACPGLGSVCPEADADLGRARYRMSGSTRDGWPPAPETIAEQVRRKGIRPVGSVDDMAQPGIFESDDELEAFLAHVHAARHGHDDAYRGPPDATAGA